MPSPVPQSL